jgi:hypothetical protein
VSGSGETGRPRRPAGAPRWIGLVLGLVGLLLAFSLYQQGKAGGALFLVVVSVAIAAVFALIGRRSRR